MSAAAPAAAFERRADRALLLARDNAAAAEPLRFAAALFRRQGRFAVALAARHRDVPLTGHPDADFGRLADLLADLLALATTEGPPELAEEAASRAGDLPGTAKARLVAYWEGGIESGGDYLSRALLRPWGETLAAAGVPPERLHREGHCPFCGGRPIVSFRRAEPESQGGARFLVCGLCGTEWPFVRIRCPSCQGTDATRLPAFQSEAHRGMRIEACDACRRYVKSVDLTLDMRPIPEVDDLSSIAMDLWAIEQGYTRFEPGWAGI
jgi:hypothetical protein